MRPTQKPIDYIAGYCRICPPARARVQIMGDILQYCLVLGLVWMPRGTAIPHQASADISRDNNPLIYILEPPTKKAPEPMKGREPVGGRAVLAPRSG